MSAEIELLITDGLTPYLDVGIEDATLVVMWSSFVMPKAFDPNRIISLPLYVETNSERLKERFLSFVDRVGNSKIGTQSVIDHLTLSPSFSYWWMTLFACKRWDESSRIIEAVRLLALEEILESRNPKRISMHVGNPNVREIVKNWSESNSVEFEETPESQNNHRPRISSVGSLPRPAKAAFVLAREIVARRKLGVAKISPSEQVDTFFVDYFSKFDNASAERGEFVSGFWGQLLKSNRLSTSRFAFIHNFVKSSSTPTREAANEHLAKFNRNRTQDHHFLLGSRIGPRTAFIVVIFYLNLVGARFQIRSISSRFTPNGSSMDLWPLFRSEWLDSLSGSTAMRHSILICDLKLAAENIPSCKQIVYLMENQPWEMAFLQIFRSRRREILVGYPHSTIRYWDLRYWTATHKLDGHMLSLAPTPHHVAANGPMTRFALESSGFRFQRIRNVEALACLYLGESDAFAAGDGTQRLLVLGDFFTGQNTALLNMFSQVDLDLRSKFVKVFKPHPSCRVDELLLTELDMKTDSRPLSDLLPECDVVISTNGTSAAAEAHQFGVRVITILNGDTPNYSPLRDVPNACFVASRQDLQEALAAASISSIIARKEYFSVDSSLTGWKELLSSN